MGGIRIIGIDPGSQRTGWGIVAEVSGVLRLVDCGIIRSAHALKGSAASAENFSGRLAAIYHELSRVLRLHNPGAAAIEQVFTSRNAASALKLGQARGVAVAACAALGMEIYDYEPTLIKKSIVGTGRAEKEQVAFMVKRLLNVRDAQWPLDTSDALAAAICHLGQRRFTRLAQNGAARP